jgi:Family of unknown function (DUF6232)
MAEETTFYADQKNVRVTDKRVILGTTTYALANITSVSTSVESPSYVGPILIFLVAAASLFGGLTTQSGAMWFIAALLVAVGALWFRSLKPTWHLRIASASGETSPLESQDQKHIDDVARAINEAIIHRT